MIRVKTSLGFSIEVGDDGRFCLPDRPFTSMELKKLARDVNRAIRKSEAEYLLEGNEEDE